MARRPILAHTGRWPPLPGLALLTALAFSTPSAALEEVTLQLKWTHQFQFAGYYMALEKGYYRDAGIDLRVKVGGPAVDVVSEVLAGRADFGVGTSSLLLDYAEGKPVVVIGVIYQHSPLVLAVRADQTAQRIEDLVGKPVMMEPHSAALVAMLRREGVSTGALKLLNHGGNPDALIQRKVHAMSAYLTDEPYVLDQEGFRYLTFSPRNYGIDFYGDNIFTRAEVISERAELVHRFREATSRGWEDALRNPDEAIELILAKYATRKSHEHLLFEARVTIDLMTRLVRPGHMLRDRWEHIADTYVEVGMLPEKPELAGFVLVDSRIPLPKWFWPALAGGACLLAAVSMVALHLRRLNTRLREALSTIRTLKGVLPICSHCKEIRDDKGYWRRLETYISEHTGAHFSHGICPTCMMKLHPEIAEQHKDKQADS